MHPAELGRYRIVGPLGRGGMGVVYEGYDPQIDRPVAIKTIALDALTEQEAVMFENRFRAEMRSAGRLQHQNIVALYDTGRHADTAYIVMELVYGQDLKRRLASGERLGTERALEVAVQLLGALDFAHRRQVIHRDIKPANVMLQTDGAVKLCDFGIARLADEDATRTQGMVLGSLRYASPEQISGLPVDARTDIFSAAVLLFELLTGKLPFAGGSDVEILHRIATMTAAPSARLFDPTIPAGVDHALRRALARDPDQRYESAAEFAQALGAATATPMNTMPTRPQRPTIAATGRFMGTPALRWLVAVAGAGTLAVGWALLRPASAPLYASAPAAASAPSSPSGLDPMPTRNGTGAGLNLAPTTAASAVKPGPAAAASPRVSESEPATLSMPGSTAAVPAVMSDLKRLPAQIPGTSSVPQPSPAIAPRLLPTARTPTVEILKNGEWPGRLSCGASRIPGHTGSDSGAFTADAVLTVSGTNISWLRRIKNGAETGQGRIDTQGRITLDGVGARTGSISATWQLQVMGEYMPEAKRIQAEVQLLPTGSGLVSRKCTLVAEQPGNRAVGGPLSAPAAPTAAAIPANLRGELSCSPLLTAPPGDKRQMAFTTKLEIRLGGGVIRWTRESDTFIEQASGSLDGSGRFTASGEGHYKSNDQPSPWRVIADGRVDPGSNDVAAQVRLLRVKDNKLARLCELTAKR